MYAVIMNGGKQYKVIPGRTLKLETINAEVGQAVDFKSILMVNDGEQVTVGAPYVTGVKVSGTVVSHGRGKKIKIVKHKRRKHSSKQMGHRQNYTEIKIDGIQKD